MYICCCPKKIQKSQKFFDTRRGEVAGLHRENKRHIMWIQKNDKMFLKKKCGRTEV